MSVPGEVIKLEYGSTHIGSGLSKIYVQATTKSGKPRCQAEVAYHIGSWPHWKQCENAATIVEDGNWCRMHVPSVVKEKYQAKQDAEQTKYDRQLAEMRRVWNLRSILSEFSNEDLEAALKTKDPLVYLMTVRGE